MAARWRASEGLCSDSRSSLDAPLAPSGWASSSSRSGAVPEPVLPAPGREDGGGRPGPGRPRERPAGQALPVSRLRVGFPPGLRSLSLPPSPHSPLGQGRAVPWRLAASAQPLLGAPLGPAWCTALASWPRDSRDVRAGPGGRLCARHNGTGPRTEALRAPGPHARLGTPGVRWVLTGRAGR